MQSRTSSPEPRRVSSRSPVPTPALAGARVAPVAPGRGFWSRVQRRACSGVGLVGVVIMSVSAQEQPVSQSAAVRLEADGQGGYRCTTAAYTAAVDGTGALQSLRAGDTEFLAPAAGTGPATGFVHRGQFVALKSVRTEDATTLVADGEPRTADAVPGANCPLTARVTYRFQPDAIELTLEQSLDQYGSFGWVPSSAVVASRDALTDCAVHPGGPAPYGQTDPRWTTDGGPVLRFHFGVWQRGFANANWATLSIGGKPVACLQSTVPAAGAIKAVVRPLASPPARDALAFDIRAADPDFLLPGGKPVRFDITVTNTGPTAVEAPVRFEVRDYLTHSVVAGTPTVVRLAGRAAMDLPTDVPVPAPGPYRAAIVVEDGGKSARDFGWVFTHDFAHYAPPNTRQPDFVAFWQQTLAESAALPLDANLIPVPEKGNQAADAFKVSFATLGGRRVYGWYARPKAPGQYPAHLRFPSSGIYPLPGPELFADRCSLWLQIHGFDVDLANLPPGDDPGKNYWTAGIHSPQTSMWRTIYVSLVRAVDFMLAQPQVDPARLAVLGGSQGGGLAMVAAGLDQRVRFCMPFHSGLPRLDWTVVYEPGYWPFGRGAKPADQTEAEFLRTLSYFDAANFTSDIRCPVVAEIGLMDTVTASGNQICALAHVPNGQLQLICSPWAMHGAGSRAAGLAQESYNRFLQGQPPITTPTKP